MSNETNVIYGSVDNCDVFTEWKNDRERIKALSKRYKSKSIVEAFKDFYKDENITTKLDNKTFRSINNVSVLEVGKIYLGGVKEIDKNGIVFDIPGVKEEIVCKENFNDCIDAIASYLETHNNQLYFEVREIKRGKITVSVINGYYRRWVEKIEKVRNSSDAISVHIDDLVQGGYLCHCNILELCELTGRKYTSSVFIPGSQIVLNIETNFERWIGEDVLIIPKNFVEFRPVKVNGEVLTENSLVGSRKDVLQILGMQNMYNIWVTYALAQKDNVTWTPEVMDGIVTGIINSSKKQGVFVELDGKYITGLLPTRDFLKYKQGDPIKVKIKDFEIQEGKKPFDTNKKGNLVKCNTRPVFEIA